MSSLRFGIRSLIFSIVTVAVAPAVAQPSSRLGAEDRSAIQALTASYARALAECRAQEYADLFVPETGYFASGFRGHIAGREKLIELVRSERHCQGAPAARSTPRPGGASGPTVEIAQSGGRVRGVADLGTAEYQDEYVKTPLGWRFASRTVIIEAEKAVGLDADDMLAINRLGGSALVDHYEETENGPGRFLSSGVRITVTGDEITGRVYQPGGGYRDVVYEESAPGEWSVKSPTDLPPRQD